MPIATCDLYDQYGEAAGVIGSELAGFGGRAAFSGMAVTVKCFEDNSAVKAAIAEPGAGKVLVIDGGGSRRTALMGDMVAKAAVANGWEGVVIDGCVRDSAELATLAIGIKARGTTPRRPNQRGEGQRDLAVTICGVAVRPGNWIYADEDGIIVLAHEAEPGAA